jgi:hypothetical protein
LKNRSAYTEKFLKFRNSLAVKKEAVNKPKKVAVKRKRYRHKLEYLDDEIKNEMIKMRKAGVSVDKINRWLWHEKKLDVCCYKTLNKWLKIAVELDPG